MLKGNFIKAETILAQITEIFIVVNTQGKILFANKAVDSYQDLAGTHIAPGISLYDILQEPNGPVFKFAIDDVLQRRRTHTAEIVVSHPSGHSVYFDINFNPIINDDSAVEFICIVARDITSQKTFEKRTLQLLKELSNLIESANAIIFAVDVEGYITEWNQECIRITGYDKEEVLGNKIDILLGEAHLNSFRELLKIVFHGDPISNYELSIAQKDKRPISILLNGTPKISGRGDVIGALFVGQDVTELMEYRFSLESKVKDRTMKLREALEKEKELVEIKNRFVSIASHEFKIPLNAISASVDSLRKTAPSNNQENINRIGEHVFHMKNLLEDVLNVDKNSSNKLKPNIQPVRLDELLDHLIKEVSDAAKYTHKFVREFAGHFELNSDEKLLRNVFINLLSNAIKFSPKSDTVVIRMKKHGDKILIEVQDFGIGIPEREIDSVFQAFTRASNTGKIKGTGLGLSIVKRAVETLGGELAVKSTEGMGTTFSVKLPVGLSL
jgi:PAS domain S-box-containing protein